MRPIFAALDAAALRHNYGVARRAAGDRRLWAVVKADAYGHGLEWAAQTLAELADGFALIELEGAVALRQAGWRHPLLMLEGFYAAAELPLFITHRLIPVLHCQQQLQSLLASDWPLDLPVYLKLNSGMHRLGFAAREFVAAHAALRRRGLQVVLMSHFADADGERGIDWQLARFAAAARDIDAEASLANSAALLRFPEAAGAWARPGIMLYGGSPFPQRQSAADLDLRPVMTLQAEIIAEQHLAAGDSVGYGCTFTASQAMRVGVVACGYADGYPRHAGDGAPVLAGGVRTRTVGRVSMDKLCVDLTPLPPQVGVGSLATLWGEGLAADEVATAADTISYELFCAVNSRVNMQWRD